MRVVIDARPALDPRRTGVGQYVQQLIRHIPFADPNDEFVAWFLHARGLLRPRRFFADVRARNLSEKASRFPARIFQPASYRLGIPRVEWLVDFDLFLATNFLAPATDHRDRVVPVVHDLAFERFPESAPHIDARWRRRFASTLAGAPAVIVPSASAANDLRESFGVAGDRTHVVHHGVDAEAFAPVPEAAIDAVRRRHGIPGPYVLFVGGIEPRKNLDNLVRAFARCDAGSHSWCLQEVRSGGSRRPPSTSMPSSNGSRRACGSASCGRATWPNGTRSRCCPARRCSRTHRFMKGSASRCSKASLPGSPC